MTVLWGYYYFQTKDHEQLPQKAWYVAKLGFMTGTGLTAFHLMNHPYFPQTATYVGRYWARSTLPLTASLVLASTSAGIISRLRGNKDDCYNYFFGCMPTAFIWSAFWKNSGKGFAGAMTMAVAAILVKILDQHDHQFINSVPRGRVQWSGSFGGLDLGDTRYLTPSLQVPDPGRRPTV